MNDDAALLRTYLKERSEAAFTELVQRHLGLVYGTACRQLGGDTHLAEDVAQAVFTDLARKAASLQHHVTLAGWLYVSTRLASANEVRREQRRKRREETALTMGLLNTPEPSIPDEERLRSVLEEAITHLKQDDREAVVLRFFQCRTFGEIGSALRITEDAARKRVTRALDQLHTLLAKRGIASTAAVMSATLSAVGAPVVPTGLATQIAGRALAQSVAAAAGGATLGSAFQTVIVPAAVLTAGAFLLVPQYRANQASARELAELTQQNAAIPALRTHNAELTRALEAVREREAGIADLSALQARLKAIPLPKPVTASNAVIITEQGMIKWEGEYITLDDFVLKLAALHGSAENGESQLTIQANRVHYRQMMYALEEARNAGITRIRVESDVTPDQAASFAWF